MDGEELTIHNMKIMENLEYVLEADPTQVERLIKDAENRKERFQTVGTKVSSASCRFDQIEYFMYGGFSSRFWALRKHINCLQDEQLENLPFKSWECISIKMAHREVDLVIKDPDQMDAFLKYLIYKTETVDGRYGSAKAILKNMMVKSNKKLSKKQQTLNQSRLERENKIKILQKVNTKYVVIRFRQKISYIAFLKKMTIVELFMDAIDQTFNELLREGRIQYSKTQREIDDKLFMTITQSTSIKGLFTEVMKANEGNFASTHGRVAIKLKIMHRI